MPAWPVGRFSAQAAAVSVVTTTETVVVTSGPINPDGPAKQVTIDVAGEITTGTSTTAIVIKVERGTVAGGTLVGTAQTVTVTTAGNKIPFGIQVVDNPGDVANQQYVCTITQTGAAANGTVDQVSISCIVA